jgi:pimeloyl-ACP methyl ester carboxylesterase
MSTFVLVHGAFLGGWCWQRVARQLRAAGHEVHTPTLTGSGDRAHLLTPDVGLATHATDIVQYLAHEDLRDVILVGHSYAGTVITVAMPQLRDRVRTLVYFDAQAPRHGESAGGIPAADTAAALAALDESSWLLPPNPLDALGVTDAADVAWVEARRHPHPMRTLLEPVIAPPEAFAGVERSYVFCTQHEGLIALYGVDPLLAFAERAQSEGWRFETLDAPHDAMTTHPAAVAAVLAAHA